MGKRRGKNFRAKKVRNNYHLRSSASNEVGVGAEFLSDADGTQSRERLRPSSPGVFKSFFGVVISSVMCLLVTWLILRIWLAVPDRDVISSLFEGLSEQSYNQGVTGAISLLAGIATIALTLRGMSWGSRELPMDSRLHRAWLQKIIDDSAREEWSFILLVFLSGLYGAVVVAFGFLAGYNGWPGISRVLLIFLSAIYVVVAMLPAFVPKSEIGTIRGYVETLTKVANLGEWRYFSLCDNELCAKNSAIKFFVTREVVRVLWVEVDRRWYRAVRFSGLWGVPLMFAVFVLIAFVTSGVVGASFGVVLYMIFTCFVTEIMLVWILGLRCRVVAMGKIDVDVVFGRVQVAFLSLLTWGVQLYSMSGFLFKGIIAVSFLWWAFRAVLVSLMKPKCGRWWPSGFWGRLSVVVGLHCVMGVWVDRELQGERGRVISYHDDNLQVADELSVAAALIVPENYVVNRVRDNGVNESKNLREYMSKVVKVTLPPVPESGSGAGK